MTTIIEDFTAPVSNFYDFEVTTDRLNKSILKKNISIEKIIKNLYLKILSC